MPAKSLARFNVVAVVPDEQQGADVLARLHDEGIDPALTSMRAREATKTPGAISPRSGRVHSLSGVGRTMLGGAAIGAVIGAIVVGPATWLFDVLFALSLSAWGALGLGALTGAIMGSTAGAMLGMEMAGRRSTMLEQSFSPHLHRIQEEDVVLVGVHTDDEEQASRVEAILEDAGVMAMHRQTAADSFRSPGWFASLLGRTIPSGSADHAGGRTFDQSP